MNALPVSSSSHTPNRRGSTKALSVAGDWTAPLVGSKRAFTPQSKRHRIRASDNKPCVKCRKRPRATGKALLCEACSDSMHAHFRKGVLAHNRLNVERWKTQAKRISQLERALGSSYDPGIDRLILIGKHVEDVFVYRSRNTADRTQILIRALEAELASRESVDNRKPERSKDALQGWPARIENLGRKAYASYREQLIELYESGSREVRPRDLKSYGCDSGTIRIFLKGLVEYKILGAHRGQGPGVRYPILVDVSTLENPAINPAIRKKSRN